MTCSSLTEVFVWSPNCYSPRAYPVTKVTVHHMAGNLSVEGCGSVFASSARQASSNYGVDSFGRIGMYVDEDDAAWTSSSYWNDNQAITIEVADEDCVNWVPSDAAYQATVNLCADICDRYGIYPSYTGDTDGTFTEHRMFAATGCPGDWWHAHMPQFVEDVKSAMGGDMTPSELLNTDVATKDSGNIPLWQAWSWAYNHAKNANEKCDAIEKDVAELRKLVAALVEPRIVKDPVDAIAKVGEKVAFSVGATGANVEYRWQYFSTKANAWYRITSKDYRGLGTPEITVPATKARNGLQFRCKVINAAGEAVSESAKLVVA